MEHTSMVLLDLLSVAMGTKKEDMVDIHNADWNKLFSMAGSHNILPMIYESVYSLQSPANIQPDFVNRWRKIAVNSSINQLYRTEEFLQIYEKLNAAGIQAIVVKGIVCRNLYPNHYYRSSGDEDVYIKKSDFNQADSILLSSGFVKEKSRPGELLPQQVTTYNSSKYGVTIELHIDLFCPESELFGSMNTLFSNAFEESITMDIEGSTIRTLSHNMHVLFLILHSIKHFLAIGFGIRQLCDLVMYCNTYGKEVDWNGLWSKVTELGYDVFLMNLFDIGIRYLGLEQSMICYPKEYSVENIHSDALLEDIMEAGIFGKSTPGQSKSSFLTFDAIAKDRKQGATARKQSESARKQSEDGIKQHEDGRRQSELARKQSEDGTKQYEDGRKQSELDRILIVLRTLFPGQEFMRSHYPYCSKYSILLPIAWIHRMLLFAAEEKKPSKMFHKANRSFAIGQKRVELLKEYQIIGRKEESS